MHMYSLPSVRFSLKFWDKNIPFPYFYTYKQRDLILEFYRYEDKDSTDFVHVYIPTT